ncbi:MAG: DNA-processing protein DprA [Mycobacteriales bacterium]
MSGASDEVRLARAALTRICEPASHGLAGLIEECGPVEALARLRTGDPPPDISRAVEARRGDDRARRDLDAIVALGGRLVCPEDDEWPVQLDELAAVSHLGDPVMPPVALWVRGPHPVAPACARSVSIVGARAASPYGTHVAGEFAYGLAERGWTVVSGGAYGVDGSSHRGALAAGGITVAVLASGVDRPYPLGHHSLFDRIGSDGLLISEWPPGCSPQRPRFLVRNRVIAALSSGTVVVEAAARSGARLTARRANELCRPLMAVPGPITSAMSVGVHQLIRSDGATLVTSAAEVIDLTGQIGTDMVEPPRGPTTPRDALAPDVARVLEGMPTRKAAPAEEIAVHAGVRLSEALRALPLLVAHGLVEERGRGYRLTPAGRG